MKTRPKEAQFRIPTFFLFLLSLNSLLIQQPLHTHTPLTNPLLIPPTKFLSNEEIGGRDLTGITMGSRIVGIAMQILVVAIVISVVLLFSGIAVLVFIHICIRGRALMQSFGDDNARRRGRGNDGGRGLSAEDLKKLPCYDYVTMQEEEESNAAECAVCLETFRAGDKCRMLPECRHSFHADCVDSWLLKSAFCPTCRTSADRGIGKGGEELQVGISTIADTADN